MNNYKIWNKTIAVLIGVFCTMSINSCKTPVNGCTDPAASNYNSKATENDGSCVYAGSVIFWDAISLGYTGTYDSIFVNSKYIGSITNSYTTGPSCGASGCVTYTAAPATYNWTDKFYTNGHYTSSKNGVFAIPGVGCTPIQVR